MSKHTDRPSSGYFVEVDCIGGLRSVRKELDGRGVSAVLIEEDGPAGVPLIRLRANGPLPLVAFLRRHDYDLDAHRVENAATGRRVTAVRCCCRAIVPFEDLAAHCETCDCDHHAYDDVDADVATCERCGLTAR